MLWGLDTLLLTYAGIITAIQTLSGDEIYSPKAHDTDAV